ncbi:MAG: PadR family transcriptional regulator [Nitrososphaeria archaeon]
MWSLLLYKYRFRKLGGLRFLILLVLAQGERTGSEIMKEIERLSLGFWRPSPGTLYPALYKLMKDGYIKRLEDGRYALTDKGNEELKGVEPLTAESFSVDHVLDIFESYIYYLKDVDKKELEKHRDKIVRISEELRGLIS